MTPLRFATIAHRSQIRKYTGEPYITHPRAVAGLLCACAESFTSDMLSAAVLHDTVEYTEATLEDIEDLFGGRVRELVYWLTDISKPSDGNRAARKALDREHIASAPPDAKTIKLCDLIDNSRSIVAHDPDFAKVYMKEKALLLPLLSEGDTRLWERANDLVNSHLKSLGEIK